MKRILIVSTVGLDYTGITSVILNYMNNMERNDLRIEFIAFEGMDEVLKQTFEKIGEVIIVPHRVNSVKKYIVKLNCILSKNRYDVIHIHGNSGTMVMESFLAGLHGVKKIIVHGHNTRCNNMKLNKILTPIMKLFANEYLCCSNAVGKWLYGKSKYIVLNNAIQLDKFQFDDNIRRECRKELNLGNAFIVGNIGELNEAKNHIFLVEIFWQFYKKVPNSKLLLVGDGPKHKEIKQKIEELQLEDAVLLLGKRKDVERLYQTMDIFLVPSKWEGLSLVTVEAQASGLPVLVSTNIPLEAKCSNRFYYKNLSDDAKSWAEEIVKVQSEKFERDADMSEAVRKCGFDIYLESKKLRNIYLS